MDINKFNSYMLDICGKLEEISKEIPEVYHQNYEYFSELRDKERRESEYSIYGWFVIFLVFLFGFGLGFVL